MITFEEAMVFVISMLITVGAVIMIWKIYEAVYDWWKRGDRLGFKQIGQIGVWTMIFIFAPVMIIIGVLTQLVIGLPDIMDLSGEAGYIIVNSANVQYERSVVRSQDNTFRTRTQILEDNAPTAIPRPTMAVQNLGNQAGGGVPTAEPFKPETQLLPTPTLAPTATPLPVPTSDPLREEFNQWRAP